MGRGAHLSLKGYATDVRGRTPPFENNGKAGSRILCPGRISECLSTLVMPVRSSYGLSRQSIALLTCSACSVLPNQRMKLSWRGGRLKGNGSVLMAAAAPRSLCAIR